MSKKLRIFWNTNAEWSISGYGNQIAELLPKIKEEGYEQAICPFYGLEGGKLVIDGILHYPRMQHVYGSDALVHHAKDFQADVALTLQDIWVLHPQDIQQIKRWIPIVPIDHDPIPPAVLERLKSAYRIVTYSQFGYKELQRVGLNSTYIQHTVDTTLFKPMDKVERKKASNLPTDSFVVGMVSANKENPPRKSFQECMDAFKLFLQRVPNALLYLHTIPDFPGGFPIKEYALFLGIQDRVLFPDAYQMGYNMGKKDMVLIYNTMDMLLCPSVNEGFGVPIIEAQSCGVPVVTNNFTAMPELVQNHITGEVCEVATKRFDQMISYVGVPSTKSIYDCMMRIKNSDQAAMSKAARDFIVKNYDTKTVFKEKWIPFLEKVEEEIYS